MLHPAQRIGPDLGPIDPHLRLLVDESADGNIIAAYQIQPVLHLLACILRVRAGEDPLDCR